MLIVAPDLSSVHFFVLVALAALVGAYLFYLERKSRPNKADALKKQYKTLTAEQLATLSDEALLPAVIANVMGKQNEKQPEPYYELPLLSPGRAAVYRVWLVCRETESGGFAALWRPKTRLLTEAAVSDLAELGAAQCAAALGAVLEAIPLGELPAAGAETAFSAACEAEQPLALCVTYIRENPAEFIDA